MKAPATVISEEKLGYAMVKSRLLTEKKLQTALDFQRSLGGTLLEVVRRLGFVDQEVLNKFLAELNAAAGAGAEEAPHDEVRPPEPAPPRKEKEREKPERQERPERPEKGMARTPFPAPPREEVHPKTPSGRDLLPEDLKVSEERTQLAPPGTEPSAKGGPSGRSVWERRHEDPVLGGLIRLLIAKGVIKSDDLDAMISV